MSGSYDLIENIQESVRVRGGSNGVSIIAYVVHLTAHQSQHLLEALLLQRLLLLGGRVLLRPHRIGRRTRIRIAICTTTIEKHIPILAKASRVDGQTRLLTQIHVHRLAELPPTAEAHVVHLQIRVLHGAVNRPVRVLGVLVRNEPEFHATRKNEE